MLGVIGDLVEDVVVRLHEEVNVASDTEATVIRRRGGSAANVVVSAINAGGRARFIGQVGDDGAGRWLTEQLAATGAEVVVRRAGRTGTIVVLLDVRGERTMLADRASATDLADPEPRWLDGLATLHIPFYSLAVEPLGATARTLAAWAHERGITVSVDAPSAAVLQRYGIDRAARHMGAEPRCRIGQRIGGGSARSVVARAARRWCPGRGEARRRSGTRAASGHRLGGGAGDCGGRGHRHHRRG